MRIDVVSIFPEYLEPLKLSLLGKAIDAGVLEVSIHDLREHATDKHRTVDDTPYGGGPGMVMKPDVWGSALDALRTNSSARPTLIIPTPSGVVFDQTLASELATCEWLVFACGRYEGIDARVAEHYANADWDVLEVSIGDYVLAGGEVATLVMCEAIVRLLPGVLGNPESVVDDSFAPGAMEGLVEGPVFTRPPTWRELDVPEVLLSGNHESIRSWRNEQAQAKTARIRPDLDAS